MGFLLLYSINERFLKFIDHRSIIRAETAVFESECMNFECWNRVIRFYVSFGKHSTRSGWSDLTIFFFLLSLSKQSPGTSLDDHTPLSKCVYPPAWRFSAVSIRGKLGRKIVWFVGSLLYVNSRTRFEINSIQCHHRSLIDRVVPYEWVNYKLKH